MAVAFPPLDDILALAGSEYERDFLRLEFSPGLAYYVNRLDRLMFAGDAVLDAGCGAGQWTLAAAQRFGRVSAVDVSESRLAILRSLADRMGVRNIDAQSASIEALPHEGESFDAVICYGVIMFTDVSRALHEFFRVLKPGGRAYLCLNGDGWSRYLIRQRGPAEPGALEAGRETLYNTYWRRANERGLTAHLRREAAELEELWPSWLGPRLRARVLGAKRRGWSVGERSARALAAFCLRTAEAGLELQAKIADECGAAYEARLIEDTWRVLLGDAAPHRRIPSEAFQPAELERLAAAAGFWSFQSSSEANIAVDWRRPAPEPKYAGYFGDDLSVWEAIVVKPAADQPRAAAVASHLRAGRAARDERLFVSTAPDQVLSTASRDGYPPTLVSHAHAVATRIGGDRYLAGLTRRIIDGAATDDQRVRLLIEFVQRSIFRDPVSQPLSADGGLPDALTILLCARGRCSHTAAVLAALFRHAGLDARVRQLHNHVVAEARVDGRWVIADADAFKNGVIPLNRAGRMLSMEDLESDPYQLDRYQPTGWFIRSGSRFARGVNGEPVRGYVDALDPHERGFVSGYYVPAAGGSPPSLPAITRFERSGDRVILEWTPATTSDGSRLIGYRVAIGTTSRGWSYDDPGDGDELLRQTGQDIAGVETTATRIEHTAGAAGAPLYAAVTAVSDRIEREPATYFWPSDEVSCG